MAHIIKVMLILAFKIVFDEKWRQRKLNYSLLYYGYSLKYILSWKLLHIPLYSENVNKYKLNFFHYSIFLSLFEDMYLNDEYYVKLPRNPVIFDLGSEVGLSVMYFKSVYPTAKIVAFEPDPTSFRLLKRNVEANDIKNTTIYNVALSNRSGSLPFYIDSAVDGSLTMSLLPNRQQKKIMVKAKKLSHYVTKKVDLVKIDIEGAELDVLIDLSRSNKLQFVENMVIEYHHHITTKVNNLSLLLRLLEKHGFGYQIKAKLRLPFQAKTYQDFLIYAYR